MLASEQNKPTQQSLPLEHYIELARWFFAYKFDGYVQIRRFVYIPRRDRRRRR